MSATVLCPNNSKCGHRTHLSGSKAYLACLMELQKSNGQNAVDEHSPTLIPNSQDDKLYSNMNATRYATLETLAIADVESAEATTRELMLDAQDAILHGVDEGEELHQLDNNRYKYSIEYPERTISAICKKREDGRLEPESIDTQFSHGAIISTTWNGFSLQSTSMDMKRDDFSLSYSSGNDGKGEWTVTTRSHDDSNVLQEVIYSVYSQENIDRPNVNAIYSA